MIVSCAPLRVSFAGGGSDIQIFYSRSSGAVLSCAIAKYTFVIIHPYFDPHRYHLKYTKTELVESIDAIQHPLLREALRSQNIGPGIEIVSVADIPSGTGLGSSSSFSVALINALHAYRHAFGSKETLAHEACVLEIEKLGEPIGKQDQYAAAYGGFNFIEFERHGGVTVHPLLLPSATIAALEKNILLFYTGSQRDARTVLADQVKVMSSNDEKFATVEAMVELAHKMRDHLLSGRLDDFGAALDRGWVLKRNITAGITTSEIDALYDRARAAGALGGKIAGAGGGGYLMLYCPVESQTRLREAFADLPELEFRFDWGGARIAFAQ